MACPTCSHTMEFIVTWRDGTGVWWCPRCGTLKHSAYKKENEISVPKLVERCQEYQRTEMFTRFWFVKGIAKNIHLPDERVAN